MTSPRSASDRGFTLVEILAVIALIGLLFTIIVSSLSGGASGQSMRIAATELRSALRYARQHAIANNCDASVLFAFDPRVTETPRDAKVTLSALYRSGAAAATGISPTTRSNYLRAFAVYSSRFEYMVEAGSNSGADQYAAGLITNWKTLPPGLVFDVGQPVTTGRYNALISKECRTRVPLIAYHGNASGTQLFGLVQAITFRGDGSVKFHDTPSGGKDTILYITEGTTNAADDYRTDLAVTYRIPSATERFTAALVVANLSGEVSMILKEKIN
jgi:prepilin-type N-terminal cleavage/methylation domain-containing protein